MESTVDNGTVSSVVRRPLCCKKNKYEFIEEHHQYSDTRSRPFRDRTRDRHDDDVTTVRLWQGWRTRVPKAAR